MSGEERRGREREMGKAETNEGHLHEVKEGKGNVWLWLYTGSVLLGLLLIYAYRASHLPAAGEKGRWAWIAVFAAELWFGFHWFISLSVRWSPLYRFPFRDRLSQRFEGKLPGVDIFIFTADPVIEPPTMVINTVLSVLAYDYPPEKLTIYLSDDGCSIFTFYALLEASNFAKLWIPFCKKFNVHPMAPSVFFSKLSVPLDDPGFSEWKAMEKLYRDMESRIDAAVKVGEISEEIKTQHEGFSEWCSTTTTKDHQAIVKILIDGRDQNARDSVGHSLPTVVYVAREKRQKYHHNFKAGAVNALLRVSAEISNGPIILILDCDMLVNTSESIRDALCFFMDEERGQEIAFVQFPQTFENITKNDLYASSLKALQWVDFHGMDGQGGPVFTGTCCFHSRKCLNGKKYSKANKIELKGERPKIQEASTRNLEERAKALATCTYEEKTQWGKEMGLIYGCPVEDVITGFSIQCRGWKSAYFDPEREAFLGRAPATLSQALVQHKRWSEGELQIFLSKYCPILYGYGKTKLGLQMCYSMYCFLAVNSIPTLTYVTIPSICLLNSVPLYPSVYSFWFIPFVFVIAITTAFSLWESLSQVITLQWWWNEQRMWLYRRTTSYLFALVDTFLMLLGITNSTFVITPKVADEETSKRYEQEIMEFGITSPMFTILTTLAMLNLFCLGGGIKRLMMGEEDGALASDFLQFLLCGSLVLINLPIYIAAFFRSDRGSIQASTTISAVAIASLAYFLPVF